MSSLMQLYSDLTDFKNGEQTVAPNSSEGLSFGRPFNSLQYRVPDTKGIGIRQIKNGCWATVAAIMINWKNRQSEPVGQVMAGLGSEYFKLYKAQKGLASSQKADFLEAAGLSDRAPQSLSVTGWERLLRNHGPVWVTTDEDPTAQFSIHARLLIGIAGNGTPDGTKLTFIDPADGREHSETLAVFIRKYESEAVAGKALRIQIVHLAGEEELLPDHGGSLSHVLERFVPRGTKSSSAKLSWEVKIAKGENLQNRVYYVLSGAHGEWTSPAKFNIRVKNKNSTKNFNKPFGAVALWTKSRGQDEELIPLHGQTGNFKYFPSTEVVDDSSHLVEINIGLDALRTAYHKLNLDDPHMQLDFRYFWREAGVFAESYFKNNIFCNFYLVNPIEFLFNERAWFTKPDLVGTLENITHRKIVKDGKELLVPYPRLYNQLQQPVLTITSDLDFSYTVQVARAKTDSASRQIGTNVTVSKTTSTTAGVEVVRENKVSFGIGNDFIKVGAESGTSISNSYQTTIANTRSVSESYLQSRAVTDQLSKAVTLSISPKENRVPDDVKVVTLFVKPIFRPVETRIVRFADIDENGVAGRRIKEKQDTVIWKFETWAVGLSF